MAKIAANNFILSLKVAKVLAEESLKKFGDFLRSLISVVKFSGQLDLFLYANC